MDNLELVQQAQKGDGEAFYRLIIARKDSLYRIAYSYVKNREDALDIVSETVYKGFKAIRNLHRSEYFYTWITRILINTSIDYAKRNKTVTPLSLLNIDLYLHHSWNSIYREEKIDLYGAIDTLRENHKTIIFLKYFNGMTLNEIAEILGVPLGTVKTNLHKALVSLRGKLKEEINIEPIYRTV